MKFELDDDQIKLLNEWMKTRINYGSNTTAIGGRYTYKFTPTSIGTFITVIDSCDPENILDLSMTDKW